MTALLELCWRRFPSPLDLTNCVAVDPKKQARSEIVTLTVAAGKPIVV